MKNIFKYLIIATMLFTVACSDDFFDKTPQGSLDPSKVDASQIEGLRNAVYAQLDGSTIVFMEGYADNGYSRNWWDSHGALVQTNTVSANAGFGYGIGSTDWLDFPNTFSSIRVCNQLIDKIDEFEQVDEAIKTVYSAEARTIRAWLYTKLTLFYGDVPIITSVTNNFDEEGVTRDPKDEVRNWIINEYDAAINALPTTKEAGRINKYVATAIKARSAYYFGNYAEAKAAAKSVIDNGGYSLHTTNYSADASMVKDAEFFKKLVDFNALGINEEDFISGIFNYQSVFHTDNNPEVILAAEYEATEDHGDFNRIASFMTPNMVGKQAWNTIAPILDLVDDYWSADGKTKPTLASVQSRIDAYKSLRNEVSDLQINNGLTYSDAVRTMVDELPNKAYMQQFTNRDSRLYASIAFPFSSISKYVDGNYQEYIPSIANYGRTGFAWRKLASAEEVVSVWGDAYYLSGLDFPLIRLPEMILIYAEAQTQTTAYDASVVSELNKLRQRCGMPSVPTGLGKEEAINFIRRERRIELAGEGFRYNDIRLYEDPERNGGIKGEQAASVVMQGDITDPVGNVGITKTWAPRLMLMPIPTNSIDKNPALKQNTGY